MLQTGAPPKRTFSELSTLSLPRTAMFHPAADLLYTRYTYRSVTSFSLRAIWKLRTIGKSRRARASATMPPRSTRQATKKQSSASAPTQVATQQQPTPASTPGASVANDNGDVGGTPRTRRKRALPLLLSSSSSDGGDGTTSNAQGGTGSESAAPPPSSAIVATGAAMDSMDFNLWDDFHSYLNFYMATSFQVRQSVCLCARLVRLAYDCVFVAISFAIDGVCRQAKQNHRQDQLERAADSRGVTVLLQVSRVHACWRVQVPREVKARSPRHTANGMWSKGMWMLVVGEFVKI